MGWICREGKSIFLYMMGGLAVRTRKQVCRGIAVAPLPVPHFALYLSWGMTDCCWGGNGAFVKVKK